MRRWPALMLTLAVTLAAGGVATAGHNGRPSVDHYVSADGTGQLIANPGGHPVSWSRCRPGAEACEPYEANGGDANIVTVSDAEPGTVYEATQDGVTARSEPWRGVLRATAPPRVDGPVRVGGHVRPVAAAWEGGWGRERDWFQLQACETAEGAGCKVILDTIKYGACRSDGGRTLPARYEGAWLRVIDARIDREQPFTQEGYSAPEGVRPLEPSPGHAAAIVGRIAAGTAPDEDCGAVATARATIRPTVRRSRTGRMALARVTCPDTCLVLVTLRQRGRAMEFRRGLAAGTATLALPRRLAQRLRNGAVAVRVRVGEQHIAARRTRLRGR